MSRELDPGLFRNDSSLNDRTSAAKPPISQPQQFQPGGSMLYPTAELKVMQSQMEAMKANLARSEGQIDQLTAQIRSIARDSELRFSRLAEQMARLEEGLSRLTKDSADRFAQVSGRLNERRVTEAKTQELVERQNVLVRNFENRLAAVHKITQDQEHALITAHAALEDARAELARIRRGVLV